MEEKKTSNPNLPPLLFSREATVSVCGLWKERYYYEQPATCKVFDGSAFLELGEKQVEEGLNSSTHKVFPSTTPHTQILKYFKQKL